MIYAAAPLRARLRVHQYERGGMAEQTYHGGCMCGSVRFEAKGAPKWVLWCHCESCRRHSGAPASVFVSFENDAVAMTSGEIAKYPSSPGVERGFCARCGSTLTCNSKKRPSETHFHIGAFAEAAALTPGGELYANERLPWFPATHSS
jgi:hypothetical protein